MEPVQDCWLPEGPCSPVVAPGFAEIYNVFADEEEDPTIQVWSG